MLYEQLNILVDPAALKRKQLTECIFYYFDKPVKEVSKGDKSKSRWTKCETDQLNLVCDYWALTYKQCRMARGLDDFPGSVLGTLKEEFLKCNVIREFRDFCEMHHAMAKHPNSMPVSTERPPVSPENVLMGYILNVLSLRDSHFRVYCEDYYLY
jgi:hypothetical protein